jgi:SAM-dependent methyltransferase
MKRVSRTTVQGDCVVCNSKVARRFLEEPPYAVVECEECRHIYTFPRPSQATVDNRYQSVGGWIKAENPELATGADSRYRFFLSLLKRVIPPPATLLDIGCSVGRFLAMARADGYECYGVEPGTDGEHAARLLGAGRIHRRLYREPVEPRCDVVTMLEVMEHIPDPRTTLKTIQMQVKDGGWFLGSVPNQVFSRLKVWPRRRFGVQSTLVPLTLDSGNHLHYFSAPGLQAILHRAGFEVGMSGAAPIDYNYLATAYSAPLKRLWAVVVRLGTLVSDQPLSSNIWFLARKIPAAEVGGA